MRRRVTLTVPEAKVGNHRSECLCQIVAHVGVPILVEGEPGRGVGHKQMAHAFLNAALTDDLLNLSGLRSKLLLVFLLGLLLAAGIGAGTKHRWLLTCRDFELSGNHVPADCRPVAERP